MAESALSFLGEHVINGKGEKVTVSSLGENSKAIGLYFSAHWCGPCRNFTPLFAKAYSENLKAKGLEVIFVSGDRKEDAFTSYFAEMPWHAIPYSDRAREAKLSRKYGVEGIPSLVILDSKTGKVITKDGTSSVREDEEGKNFPWTPKSMEESFGTSFVDGSGKEVTRDQLKQYEAVGIYFSAHWCPPCKGFTPKLVETYNKINKDNKRFEIIFASSDRDEGAFKGYFAEMPWIAVPYSDRTRKNDLSKRFGVRGIPSLVILDPKTLKTINGAARGRVDADPEGAEFPWAPKPVNELTGNTVNAINSAPSVLALLGDAGDDVAEKVRAAMEPAAQEVLNAADAAEEPAEFVFYYGRKDGIVDRVKSVGSITDSDKLVVFSVPDKKCYKTDIAIEGITEAAIRKLLADYRSKSLGDGVALNF